MAIFDDFLPPVFAASPVHGVQHVSDLHLKSALATPYVCASMVGIQCVTAEIRRGKKIERKKERRRNHGARI